MPWVCKLFREALHCMAAMPCSSEGMPTGGDVLQEGVPFFIWGRSTESMEGLPSIDEENCEDVDCPPTVLLLLPLGLSMPLVESRNALSSENCTCHSIG